MPGLMSGPPGLLVLAGAVALLGAAAPDAHGQAWSVDLSAGRIDYTAVAADLGTAHLTSTVRYEPAPSTWLSGGGALPLSATDPLWTTAGGGRRWWAPGWSARTALGLDVTADTFLFRDRLVSRSGAGAGVELLPFVRLPAGEGHLDLRAGWRGHVLSHSGTSERRGVFDTGARFSYGGPWQLVADTKVVYADGTAYPFVGGGVVYAPRSQPVHLRVHAGRWVSGALSDVAWDAKLALPLGQQTFWAGVRQDGSDPLYWNAPRRTWSAGVTRRLGRPRVPAVPASVPAGTATIRISARDAPGARLSIAGDINGWQPVAMRREGDGWVVQLSLPAGVYHYAFRAGAGEWFVPASATGRRPDGFGGHVAVLVVS
jgi:hypothetical protein